MNKKLKQLFSAHALAATIATGMLVSATVLAVDCISAVAYDRYAPQCGTNTLCSAVINSPGSNCNGHTVYWCCDYPKTCSTYANTGTCDPTSPYPYAYGYCCPYP